MNLPQSRSSRNASRAGVMMEQLWYAIDRLAPYVHDAVAQVGKVPAGAVTVALMIVAWYFGRRLAHWVIVLPGLGAGWATAAWLFFAHGWHPLLCVAVALAISAAMFQLLASFFYLRLAIAVVLWPLALLTIWHLASGALDTLWAVALTWIGAGTVGSLLRRLVNTENHDLYVWVTDLIDDLRGD
jgi:hypothetical protein